MRIGIRARIVAAAAAFGVMGAVTTAFAVDQPLLREIAIAPDPAQ
jgi:hypothetical protein